MRKSFGIVLSVALVLIGSAQVILAQKPSFYDLGTYPGGTWAEPRDINNSGVIVGFGDIASGYTRPIGVPLFGQDAAQWFDLGTLGGDRTDMEVMCMGIADTGMIVGHAAITGDEFVHAFAWTPKSGMVDIGTLTDLGYSFSLAYGNNKAGTLIVGWSSSEFLGFDSLPVVWTPKAATPSGGPAPTWNIQKLDTEGFEQASYWYATFANGFGQIVGTAWDDSAGAEIAVLWNPIPGGKGWKIMKLPVPPDYPNAWANDINEKGEIVGGLASEDWGIGLPALWKPVKGRRGEYNLTVLSTLSGELQWDEAIGLNDKGDIVGYGYDKDSNMWATRWSTSDTDFVEELGSPGTWSWAWKVNNSGIVAGSYGSDTIGENIAAWKLR